MTFKVNIASITVTSDIIRSRIKKENRNQAIELVLETTKNIENTITLSNGQTVEVWENFGGAITDPDDKRFKGQITKIEREGGSIKIICKDELFILTSTLITRVYLDTDVEAGKISEIFKSLIEDNTTLTTTVTDSGTTFTLEKFVCRNRSIIDAIEELAKTLDWQFYYDPVTDKVIFEPAGNTINTSTLTVGTEIIEVPKWNEDTTEMINKLRITGAAQLVETSEFFSGDGATATFTLTEIPESAKVYVGSVNFTLSGNDFPHKDNANLKTGSIENLDTTQDYNIDKETKTVNFTSGNEPSNNTNNVEVLYIYKQPIPLLLTDSTSISNYKEREREITLKDVRTVDDAIERGRKILETFKNPFLYSELKVNNTSSVNLNVGERVAIVDSTINGVSDTFIVHGIIEQYPEKFDIVKVGEREFTLEDFTTQLEGRIKRLEEDNLSDVGAPIQLVQSNTSFNIRAKQINIYELKGNDSFILGHSGDNGKLGRGKILDNIESGVANWTPTNAAIAQSTDQAIEGTYSMKVTPSGTSITLLNTTPMGDLSTFTGVGSGTPLESIVGIWVYVTATTDITAMTLRIGSSATDYTEANGVAFSEVGFTLAETGWNYILFNLATGSVTGTPNWTAVDYIRLVITADVGLPIFYLDYLTIGDGSSIALNGLGNREGGNISVFSNTYV